MVDMLTPEEYYAYGKKNSETFLKFQFEENPSWHQDGKPRTVEDTPRTVKDMLKEFTAFYDRMRDQEVTDTVFKAFRDQFIVKMSTDEDTKKTEDYRKYLEQCCNPQDNRSLSEKSEISTPRETENMLSAFKYLQENKTEADGEAILSKDIVLEAHGILMKGLSASSGQLCKNPRETTDPVTKETVNYPEPNFVDQVLQALLDYSNSIVYFLKRDLKEGKTDPTVEIFVKFLAWFFFNFIHLHPFGNGNGRLARLLCCYLGNVMMKVPAGIYNIYSPSKKDDYLEAISKVRKRNEVELKNQSSDFQRNQWQFKSKPKELATMILECMWCTCKEYDNHQKK